MAGRSPSTGTQHLFGERPEAVTQDLLQKLAPEGGENCRSYLVFLHRAIPLGEQFLGLFREVVFRLDISNKVQKDQGGDGGAFGVYRRHVVDRRIVQSLEPVQNTTSPVLRGVAQCDVVRVVAPDDTVVGGDDEPGIGVLGTRQLLEGNVALPLMFAGPAGHGQPGVGHRPDWDLSSVQVRDVPLHVREEQIVARVHPLPHGLVHLVGRARVQHFSHALHAKIDVGRRRIPEREAVTF